MSAEGQGWGGLSASPQDLTGDPSPQRVFKFQGPPQRARIKDAGVRALE